MLCIVSMAVVPDTMRMLYKEENGSSNVYPWSRVTCIIHTGQGDSLTHSLTHSLYDYITLSLYPYVSYSLYQYLSHSPTQPVASPSTMLTASTRDSALPPTSSRTNSPNQCIAGRYTVVVLYFAMAIQYNARASTQCNARHVTSEAQVS